MSGESQSASNEYAIQVDRLDGEVRAFRNGEPIAASRNAKVMYETRLPPAVYFPVEDVIINLSETENLKSFCPFKGTASYYDLNPDNEQLVSAAWAYNNGQLEGREVKGHISFDPNIISDYDLGDNILDRSNGGNITGPTVDWILREAWLCSSPQELTGQIARKLLENGIAISRLSIMIWSLHPLIAGRNYVWTKKSDTVETYNPTYDIHSHPAYVNSPIRYVSQNLGGVRQRLDVDEAEFSFPIMQELKSEGATDYVAMPLPFASGQTNVLALTCDHPDGFTTANLGLLFECSSVISRYFEVFALQENAQSLLETYLGKRTGKRVLGGEIRRGDGDEIDAAILFCDLRGSTLMETTMGRDAYIELLNRFFEETTDIINSHGGEVLKFIGDAVLAIFPAEGDQARACEQAMNSAKEIVEKVCAVDNDNATSVIDCAIGIAFGPVTYGNIGSRERLDFTVIGSAANIAARLGDYSKTTGHRIIATNEIALTTPSVVSLGSIELHNVSEPVEAYALTTQ